MAVMLAGMVGGAALALLVMRSTLPGAESAEAGFARDMATHHAQAVEMSLLIRDRSADETLRTLAYDIIVTQSTQRGVFMGWLQAWGAPQTSSLPRMAWMPGHSHAVPSAGAGVPLMHGMASEDEMRRLHEARGAEAEVLGAAKSIQDSQRAEITAMTEMLAKRSARPFASLLE